MKKKKEEAQLLGPFGGVESFQLSVQSLKEKKNQLLGSVGGAERAEVLNFLSVSSLKEEADQLLDSVGVPKKTELSVSPFKKKRENNVSETNASP